MKRVLLIIYFFSSFCFYNMLSSQAKPSVHFTGGDNVPILKQQFQATLEMVLLEMNRINKGVGSIDALKTIFSTDAYETFKRFVTVNSAYTARIAYTPQIIERQKGDFYDIRSITVKVHLGETEASENQNLIFTFKKKG